ncbi:MAG TPA: hypothetical protein VFU15_12235 [Bacteroidia bacterium]|nr:hypothetical protein [Bacteroidia bacterium]
MKRPRVPAAYSLKFKYDYSKEWNRKRFWESRSKTAQRGYKAWLSDPFPPQPVSVRHNEGDSVNALADSTQMESFFKANDRPAGVFPWQEYLATTGYSFAWSDSVKIDSARVQFLVNSDGSVVFTPMPWKTTDSTSRQFEQVVYTLMRKFWIWYPSQQMDNRNSKLRNIPCKVTITIYAVDKTVYEPGATQVPVVPDFH